MALERRYPGHLVSAERELLRDERAFGGRLASARMSWRSRWGDSHRPDLVVWSVTDGAAPVAVEVELTPKAPARLVEICRAWARCRHVAGVLYWRLRRRSRRWAARSAPPVPRGGSRCSRSRR